LRLQSSSLRRLRPTLLRTRPYALRSKHAVLAVSTHPVTSSCFWHSAQIRFDEVGKSSHVGHPAPVALNKLLGGRCGCTNSADKTPKRLGEKLIEQHPISSSVVAQGEASHHEGSPSLVCRQPYRVEALSSKRIAHGCALPCSSRRALTCFRTLPSSSSRLRPAAPARRRSCQRPGFQLVKTLDGKTFSYHVPRTKTGTELKAIWLGLDGSTGSGGIVGWVQQADQCPAASKVPRCPGILPSALSGRPTTCTTEPPSSKPLCSLIMVLSLSTCIACMHRRAANGQQAA
jgi:hypothetical protein